MTSQLPPSRGEVQAWFNAVLDGSRTRDEADRWAAGWYGSPAEELVTDDVVWWALGLLVGIDLTGGPEAAFLHDDEQLREWLDEFRRRCDAHPL